MPRFYFVLVFFSPFSIAITSLREERASLGAFRTFVRFALVWFCPFPVPLGAWEGLRFVILAFPGLFSYLFYDCINTIYQFIKSFLDIKCPFLRNMEPLTATTPLRNHAYSNILKTLQKKRKIFR